MPVKGPTPPPPDNRSERDKAATSPPPPLKRYPQQVQYVEVRVKMSDVAGDSK